MGKNGKPDSVSLRWLASLRPLSDQLACLRRATDRRCSSHPPCECFDNSLSRMTRQMHDVKAVTWQGQGMGLHEGSVIKLTAHNHVAENGNALPIDHGIDRVQFLAET